MRLQAIPWMTIVLVFVGPVWSAPKYDTVIPWTPRDKDEQENTRAINRHVQAMVPISADPKHADFAYTLLAGENGQKPDVRALQALAVMNALPYLTKGNPDANEKLFLCAREAARKVMARVLEAALPEYWDTVKEKPAPPRAAVPALDIQAQLYPNRVYSLPILLMALEMYFNGALEISYDSERMDRAARGAVNLPQTAQLGVARLTALLISKASVKAEPGQPHPFDGKALALLAMFEYQSFGDTPERTCLHKSGFAFMGLRAAASLLSASSFAAAAFEFPWQSGEPPLGRKRFLDRYGDALVHCLRCVMEIPATAAGNKPIGVTFDDYRTLQPQRAPLFGGSTASLNVLNYRTLYATNRKGERILTVESNRAAPAWPAGVPQEVVFRYLPEQAHAYGTYHTLQAAYIAVTAANTLPLLLEAVPGGVGKQYPITPHPVRKKTWRLGIDSRTLELHLDPKTGPFTGLRVTDSAAPDTLHWDINLRVAQCVNFVLRAATRPTGSTGQRELDDTEVSFAGTTMQRWEATLAVHATHAEIRRGVCLYGFVKFGIAAGCPDTFGPWPYYADLCRTLRDDAFALPAAGPDFANREFYLLIFTRGYRPLFGRDSGK